MVSHFGSGFNSSDLSSSDDESSELDLTEALARGEEKNLDEAAPAPPCGPLAASGQASKSTRGKMSPSLHFRTSSSKLSRAAVSESELLWCRS